MAASGSATNVLVSPKHRQGDRAAGIEQRGNAHVPDRQCGAKGDGETQWPSNDRPVRQAQAVPATHP